MAVRLDQETLIKYADKAFLGLALLLLLFAAVAALKDPQPEVDYRQVVNAYNNARDRQDADIDWQQVRNMFADTPEDQKTLALLRACPSIAETFNLTPVSTPRQQFVTNSETLPGAVWADSQRLFAYLPSQKPEDIPVPQVKVPPLAERTAPVDLLMVDQMVYLPTGKEAGGEQGYDIYSVTGQARIDLTAHLEAWKRWAAQVPDVQKALRSLYVTRVVVQRRELAADGNWTEWETRPTVQVENVTGRALFVPPVQPDIVAMSRDEAMEKDYIERIKKYQNNLARAQKDILRPPFYPLGGNQKWHSPYSWHKFAMDEGNRTTVIPVSGRESRTPAETGFTLPGIGEPLTPAPAPETKVNELETDRVDYTEFWFNEIQLIERAAGKTFQYRVQLRYLNPYITIAEPGQAEDADRLTIEYQTQWSEPSTVVTLPKPVEFFFVGQIGSRANVDLYRWIHGQWYQVRSRTFEIGEDIRYQADIDLSIPTARGHVTTRKKVVFDTGAGIVDLRDDNMLINGTRTSVKKMIYLMQPLNVLGSLIDRTGRDASANFWKKAQQTRIVEERKVEDQFVEPEPMEEGQEYESYDERDLNMPPADSRQPIFRR